MIERRFNKRFASRPDRIHVVHSTDQVIAALDEAVKNGLRVAVTSGGHCLEGFVSDPDVRVIIDVSPMKGIYFDPNMRAIAVEAGVTVGEAFQTLFDTWGTVIPLGEYPGIGMGGHVVGGAFGFLCRQLGLAADYLYGVEVVTVNESGRAQCVVATRDTNDPHRDLWWAHTGAGGGNYGVVTRYWFRALARTASIRQQPCLARPSRSPRSEPNGTGAGSIDPPFSGCSRITARGTKATAVPIHRTHRSGRCSSSIAGSSARSCSAR